jgi:hypothetical protein
MNLFHFCSDFGIWVQDLQDLLFSSIDWQRFRRVVVQRSKELNCEICLVSYAKKRKGLKCQNTKKNQIWRNFFPIFSFKGGQFTHQQFLWTSSGGSTKDLLFRKKASLNFKATKERKKGEPMMISFQTLFAQG